MTESEVEGASLPTDGIDVDETSAYFGVTQTSDLIIRLNETDRLNGLGEFLTLTSDLLLTDQFDFDVVSERLGCESGEIYYLFSGPFEIFTMTDPLRLYLGQQDSEGNQGLLKFQQKKSLLWTPSMVNRPQSSRSWPYSWRYQGTRFIHCSI